MMFSWIVCFTSQYLESLYFDLFWIELFEKELFEHLTVWKKIFDI